MSKYGSYVVVEQDEKFSIEKFHGDMNDVKVHKQKSSWHLRIT